MYCLQYLFHHIPPSPLAHHFHTEQQRDGQAVFDTQCQTEGTYLTVLNTRLMAACEQEEIMAARCETEAFIVSCTVYVWIL